jgi:ATP-dependent helicase/nuclease subunit A
VLDALTALDADVNGLLARGLLRVLTVAVDKYERLLDEHAVIDFAGMLSRAVALLERQEEFARSRLKLQARYHHVLVDEFQDTSRAQWRLIELLIAAWGEGEGAADAPTSIFIVGERKQSIYRFRHAEATLLEEAARRIAALRPGRPVRHAITHSFRAVPELLAFVNALADQLQSGSTADDRFHYGETDRFVLAPGACDGRRDGVPVVGLIAETTMPRAASAVAAEVERLLASATVRDRDGAPRAAKPDDVVILFRARAGHQYFEDALEARGIRTYVYKGLGFFDVAEVQDLQALLRYLARPESDLRAAEFLRSRLVRLSDVGLAALAPNFAAALRTTGTDPELTPGDGRPDRGAGDPRPLGERDAALLARARASVARWLALADRVPPSELIDLILRESAYVYEMRGRRLEQARENVKKVRSLVRRVESRGYATLERLADYFGTLQAGDESNAIVAASGCVNLMTIHAAKGLEFPIVFVVNLQMPGRGRPAGFSVIERGPAGEPDVAFGQSEATRAEEEREAEELRRLMYVAVTRARDRLYLAAEVDEEGRLRRGARSLAALLPPGLSAAMSAIATTDADCVTWQVGDGAFALAVCRAGDPVAPHASFEPASPEGPFDLDPVSFGGPLSVSASPAAAGGLARVRRPTETTPAGMERLVGTLVHRLFQRRVDHSLDTRSLADSVAALLRSDEASALADPDLVCAGAADLYQRMAGRPDLVELLGSGECHYEVPFSYQPADRPGEVIRGAIDCLIVSPTGPVTVVEFKTGDPRPEHEVQGAMYARAVGELLPNRRVEVRIVYP